MIKPCGPLCNLACDYCYYLPKAHAYSGSDFKMSSRLLSNITSQIIAAEPVNEIDFCWQGGEPTLMGLEFFKEAIRLQQMMLPKTKHITNNLQTNGTLLTPDWCQFFKDNDFLIGISLDGPLHMHNAFRHDKDGYGSYHRVIQAIRLLKQYKVNFNVLCCIHRVNVNHPVELYQFLKDEIGAQFIQFIPIIQREPDQNGRETQTITDRSVDAISYGKFLSAIYDQWVHHDIGKIFFQIFDLALGVYLGQPANLCVFAETCGRALVLEHNGDLYSCDHFVNPKNLVGNINQTPLIDLLNSEKQAQFGNNKRDRLPRKCLDCDVRFLCHGGCPINRDEFGLNILCKGYQLFFRHIDRTMQIMAELIIHKQSPSKVVDFLDLEQRYE
jgi:uncharacterized protein